MKEICRNCKSYQSYNFTYEVSFVDYDEKHISTEELEMCDNISTILSDECCLKMENDR